MKTRHFLLFAALLAAPLMLWPQLAVAEEAEQAGDAADSAEVTTLKQLLELVRQGKVREDSEAKVREERFSQQRSRQKVRLEQMRILLKRERERSTQLEDKRNENNLEIARLRELKEQKEGSLKEIFGNLQASASEIAAAMSTSLVTAQLGTGRITYLQQLTARLENTDRLPSMGEIERLWYEIQREMYQSGRVVKFQTEVIGLDGVSRPCEAYRISLYAITCDGQYVVLQSAGHLSTLARQPSSRYVSAAGNFAEADEGEYAAFGIDPTGPQGNSLLKNLISSPTLGEQIEQGGIIGSLIIGLGAFGLLVAVFKFLYLLLVGYKILRQLNASTISLKNPLGRILQVFEDNQNTDVTTLEIKMEQAITTEKARIGSFVSVLKIIATVAPLMGLLGTVTGMIITFQQITIYGTGDPKTMAGGISVALVTTVLGLTVAIPMVLLHTLVASRAHSLLSVLEHRSLGIVARRAEAAAANGGNISES